MSDALDPTEGAVVAAFLAAYRRDLQARAVCSLEQYQARYPGFKTVIARELAALQQAGGEFGARGDLHTVQRCVRWP